MQLVHVKSGGLLVLKYPELQVVHVAWSDPLEALLFGQSLQTVSCSVLHAPPVGMYLGA